MVFAARKDRCQSTRTDNLAFGLILERGPRLVGAPRKAIGRKRNLRPFRGSRKTLARKDLACLSGTKIYDEFTLSETSRVQIRVDCQ